MSISNLFFPQIISRIYRARLENCLSLDHFYKNKRSEVEFGEKMAMCNLEEERRWEELGADCLVQIFSKLKIEDLTLGVPFVCKPWHEAALDPQCWRVLDFRGLDLMPWGSFCARFKQIYSVTRFSFAGLMKILVERSRGSASELAFPSTFGATLQELVYASIKCPKLKVLAMPDLFREDDKHIPELVGKWKDLEFLEMGRKPFTFTKILEQIALNCRNLRGLQLYGFIGVEDVSAIVGYLPKLGYLGVRGSYLDKDVLLAIIDGCKGLEELDATQCKGFVVDDEILKRASCLKVFEFEGARLEEDYMDDYGHYDDVLWGLVF